jgi:hypothetical protein
MAFFCLGYVSMSVSDDGFIERSKRIARFGKLKVLSENTVVIDDPSVYLLQQY